MQIKASRSPGAYAATFMLRFVVTLCCLAACCAWAEPRPPARDHAPAEFFAAADGGVDAPGARFLATLPVSARDAVRREGYALLDQKSAGGGPSLLRAVVRFDRPRDEVFALITQPSQQKTFLPHVEQSKTVGERTAEGEAIDMVVSFLFTFRYRTQHWYYPDEHRMEWNLDTAGGDGLMEQFGFWQLYELDEKTTIAEYGTRIVARGALLNFLRSLGERGAIGDALEAFRKHVHTAKLD